MHPGANQNRIGDWREGRLTVAVTAPAHEGLANRSTIKLLAKQLGIAPSRITIIRGETMRNKLIEVDGLGDNEISDRLRRS